MITIIVITNSTNSLKWKDMKTLKHIALLFITLATLTACEDYYEETLYSDDFEVRSNHWQLIGDPNEVGSYYEYVHTGVPLNTSYYEGVVTAYLYLDYGTKYEVQTPLPYTEYIVEKINGKEFHYSIHYTYDVKADNTIAFKAYVSDYYTGDFNPGTQYFRVAIIW